MSIGYMDIYAKFTRVKIIQNSTGIVRELHAHCTTIARVWYNNDMEIGGTVICEVAQVRTLADGGIRITLDLPEDAIECMAHMAACHAQGIAIRLTYEDYDDNRGSTGDGKRRVK
jgi:hypothetical protein